jgi:hypothetical protein
MAKGIKKTGLWDGLEPTDPVVTSTSTRTPTYTPAHATDRKAKERKTERLQLLVRPSTKARLAKYAEDHNTSSNEVVQQLLDNLLDSSGY